MQGPPEGGGPRLTLEQSEELTRRIVGADGLNDARTVLEDAPEEVLGRRNRWAMVDALVGAASAANEEVIRYKRELGLED